MQAHERITALLIGVQAVYIPVAARSEGGRSIDTSLVRDGRAGEARTLGRLKGVQHRCRCRVGLHDKEQYNRSKSRKNFHHNPL